MHSSPVLRPQPCRQQQLKAVSKAAAGQTPCHSYKAAKRQAGSTARPAASNPETATAAATATATATATASAPPTPAVPSRDVVGSPAVVPHVSAPLQAAVPNLQFSKCSLASTALRGHCIVICCAFSSVPCLVYVLSGHVQAVLLLQLHFMAARCCLLQDRDM